MAMAPLQIIFVTLRLITRRKSCLPFGVDDITVLLSLILQLICLAEAGLYLVCACIMTIKPLVDSTSSSIKTIQWYRDILSNFRVKNVSKQDSREEWVVLDYAEYSLSNYGVDYSGDFHLIFTAQLRF
ncbi:hypothetical protein N7488_007267 [Penicillium malachiteum]|nr:hypothetical protein N7488_007267 [Penicillium malachiteum]